MYFGLLYTPRIQILGSMQYPKHTKQYPSEHFTPQRSSFAIIRLSVKVTLEVLKCPSLEKHHLVIKINPSFSK